MRSADPVNDGQWHHLVATVGAGGTQLYVDGAQVAADPTMTRANTRVGAGATGCSAAALLDRTSPDAPASLALAGAIDEVAVYPTTLTAAQVAQHFALGHRHRRRNAAPTASFTATPTELGVAVDATGIDRLRRHCRRLRLELGRQHARRRARRHGDATPTRGRHLHGDPDGDRRRRRHATTARSVTVAAPPTNPAPTASFTATPTGLSVSANGSASRTPPPARSPSYAWNWGDSTHDAGRSGEHGEAHVHDGRTYTITPDRHRQRRRHGHDDPDRDRGPGAHRVRP